jgi:hypothetical protein
MFNKNETEFLQKNFKAAIINAGSVGATAEVSMWTNILLKLQAMPTEEDVKKDTTVFNTFDQDNIKMLRQTLVSAIDLSKNNLAGKIGNISYTANSADIKLQIFVLENGNGKPVDKLELQRLQYMKDLPRYAHLGFTEKHFLKEFTHGKTIYQFTGFILKGKKFLYHANRKSDGANFKFMKSIEKLVL